MAKKDKILSEEETTELKNKAREILSLCRRNLLIKYPFIGNVALRMDLIPVRDVRCRTACTDGENVYFDIAFLSNLSRDEQNFVLAHEVWHAVLMHLIRRHNRLADLFNIATDKEINYMLSNDGFTVPADCCMPESNEQGKCAEEIYEMMLNKAKKQQMPNMSGMNGPSSSSKNQNSNSSSSSSSRNNSNSNSNQQDGKNDGTLRGQFDKHVYSDMPEDGPNGNEGQPNENGNDNGENGNGDSPFNTRSYDKESQTISDKYGQVGFDKDFKTHVSKNFGDKMREIIISEAQRTMKTRGTLPAAISSLVDTILTPEIKWQELLAQFVTKCYNSGNYSWIPPNRRYVHQGIYLPRRMGDKIRMACIIDTSGSTVGDRGKFLGELVSLVRSFGKFDLHLIECDADVGSYHLYTEDDDLENIIIGGEYEMTGGGGTAMTPALDYIIDNQLEVDAVCCMTDGYIESIPKNPTNLPMLWIITKDGTEDFCDWGQKVKFKNDDNSMRI